jgi:hypothetical protein
MQFSRRVRLLWLVLPVVGVMSWLSLGPGSSPVAVAADGAVPAVLDARLRGLEARVAELERRLDRLVAVPADAHSNVPDASAPVAGEDAGPAGARLQGLEGVPGVIADRLSALHPGGRVVERGRDREDGYWWFEVRRDGVLYDVEISEQGGVFKNHRTDD